MYDPKPAEKHGEYHVMSYEHHNLDFQIVDDWEDEIDNEKLEKELEDLLDGTHNGIYLYSYPTHIRGFGNKEVITDGRVYREGMALHYFTELVCQYLNEPMFNNTY